MQDFRRLTVWKAARAYRIAIYQASEAFPYHERFNLTAQIRSSASSIGWNIAEGCGRGSDADFARFIHHALGSANENHDQLIQALDLAYLRPRQFTALEGQVLSIGRQLSALMKRRRE